MFCLEITFCPMWASSACLYFQNKRQNLLNYLIWYVFYDKVTCLVGEGRMVNIIFWILIRLLMPWFCPMILYCSLQHPSVQVVQLWDEQVCDALGEELVKQQGSAGCSECGYIWLVSSHQWCCSRLNPRASSVQHFHQWSGCRSWTHHLQV